MSVSPAGEKAAALKDILPAHPRTRSALGATAALGLYAALGRPLAQRALRSLDELPQAVQDLPEPVRGKDLLGAIDQFKKDHPEVKDVPVYASGKVPRSMYVPGYLLKVPLIREAFQKHYGIEEPGVYIRELSAPVALHELGHAALDRKVPGIGLLTHGTSMLAIPLLAQTILSKPVAQAGFVRRYAPAIAGALQLPVLAEEAAASIIAHETLKRRGQSGGGQLLPAWFTYLLGAGAPVAAQAAATALKR